MDLFIMCHGLAEASGDTIQNDIDKVLLSHINIDIKSIDIIQVFLNSTCLTKIIDFIERPVWHVVVTIVVHNTILNLFPSSIPVLVCCLLLQNFSFYT